MGKGMEVSKSLIEIASEAMAIEELLLSQGGEISPEVELWLSDVERSLSEKSDQYKFAMDRFQSTAKLLKEKADEFLRAAKAIENISERLKLRIKDVMLMTGRDEIKGRHYKFKLSQSQPKLVIREDELPREYLQQVVTYQADKDRIKEIIKQGQEIKGVKVEPVHALRVTVNKE